VFLTLESLTLGELRLAASSAGANSLLAEASRLEKQYEWEEAAGVYERILQAMPADDTERPAVSLRLAICHESAASQTGDASTFRGKMEEAIAVYQEMERTAGRDSLWAHRAAAGRLRLEGTLTEDAEARRSLFDKAIDLQRSVIMELERRGPSPAWLEAGNFSLLLLYERFLLDQQLIEVLKEGLALAEKLKSHARNADIDARALAHVLRAYLAWHAKDHFEDWHRDPSRFDCVLQEALALEHEIRDGRILAALLEGALYVKSIDKGLEVTFEDVDKLTAAASATRDREFIGRALSLALYFARWRLVGERDQEQAEKKFQEAVTLFKATEENLAHLRDAASQYALGTAYGDLVQSYYVYAEFATDVGERKQLIEKAVTSFRKGLPIARLTGGIALGYLEYAGAEALRQLARLEDDERRKLEILAEAVVVAEECNVVEERVSPLFTWNTGVGYMGEGSLRYDLAQFTHQPVKRRELLEAAVSRFQVGFKKIRSYTSPLSPGQVLRLGDFYLRFVRALDGLFEETGGPNLLSEQLQATDLAAEAYSSVQRPARVAEAIWHRARVHSRKGEHKDAAQDYARAAEHFREAAAVIPSLGDLYQDLEKYLQGWGQIEEARAAHADALYREASGIYRQASSTLEDARRWSPLSEHYVACALLEGAEALSHEESPELASQAFIEAAEGFATSRQAIIEWRPFGMEEEREKDRWSIVTAARERYCRARAGLEEAKLLDRMGKRGLSARGFAASAAILESLAEEEESAEGKQEMRMLALVGQAWGLMKEGEVGSKAEKYEEAARIFEQVAGSAANERLAATCRGSAAFCRALESGTRLRLSWDPGLYRETKDYLEMAADHYTEAGMERAANWTRATEYMFDGLAYFAQAEGTLQAQEKGSLYALTERSFEAAAQLYGEAGYIGKQEEASRHLGHAREKRRVFTSPAEALDAAVVLQVAQGQVAPSLTRDQSLGIEQFEASNVQAKLVVDRSEVAIGETSQLRVELVNAGRASAVLVKVSELTPSKFGMELIGEKYRVEDGAISLKGLRLNPFDTAEIGVQLKTNRSGEFVIQPRIHYLDDQGRYQQHQPQPVIIIVQDLGGEARARAEVIEAAPVEFEFRKPRAKAAFDYLVNAFMEDYMAKRLYLEQAGWRTLTQIAKMAKIPISSVYGRRGGYGAPISELLSRGLVETRIFTEQRGRGGEVVKIRISYDKEPVKRYVDQIIKKPM